MRFRLLRVMIISLLFILCTTALSEPVTVNKDRKYYEQRNEITWEVPTSEKVIALTFDDGPDPADTPAILDLLREYNARATFFVIGKRVKQFPELVLQEVMEGHEIANHTYSHPSYHRRVSMDKIVSEMEQAEEIIVQVTGQKPRLFRPPGGYYSEQIVRAAKKYKYQVILWSWHQDTEDWNTPGVHKIVENVLRNARNGDIILFHDYVKGATQTVDALGIILPELSRRGFRFVTVSELLTYKQQTTPVDRY